jgi:predicted NBD/HSP70 family sugar kinase
MNPVSVKHHVDRLLDEGKIERAGSRRQGRGRPREILRPNPRSGYVVGIDMEPTRAIAVITDMGHNVIAEAQQPIQPDSPGIDIVQVLIGTAKTAIASAAVPRGKILGAGFAISGFYDRKAGMAVMSATMPHWRDVPVRYLLQRAFSHPVLIDDSVTAATMAEKWFGCGRGISDFISLRVRTSISLGVVINGHLHRGRGNAGTINDLYALPLTSRCDENQPRTLYQTASGAAILEQIKHEFNADRSPVLWQRSNGSADRLNLDLIVESAQRGDPLCIAVLQAAARGWGRALARVFELLHPEKVILTGTFSELSQLLHEPLLDAMRESVYPALRDQVSVEFSTLGRQAGALGAAALVIQQAIRSKSPISTGT